VLHAETGRIFRIMPEQSLAENWEGRYEDLNNLSDHELVALQTSKSDWHSRRARGILQKRAAQESLDKETIAVLKEIFVNDKNTDYRLRALWTLHQVNGWQEEELIALLEDRDPYIRSWAIQLLCEDKNPPQTAWTKFLELAEKDPSATVRLYLAAALQRIPEAWKWEMAAALTQREEDQSDHNIPKMIWFGTEYLMEVDPERLLGLAAESNIPLLTRFIARRAVDGDLLALLVATIQRADRNKAQLLEGMLNGMEGRTDLEVPVNWKETAEQLNQGSGLQDLVAQISARFGDAEATQKALATIQNKSENKEVKVRAIQMLAAQQKTALIPMLPSLLEDSELRGAAIRAVAGFNRESLGKTLIDLYPSVSEEEKTTILQSLASRSVYGNLLMQEIKSGNITKKEVPVTLARQLHRVIGSGFVEIWGPIEHVPSDEAAYENYRKLLTADALKQADLQAGKKLFMQSCGSCHKMFGEGADIGPDLTGSNRQDPDYILLNVLEPSAEIQDAYRLVIITTMDGRTYTGNVVAESPRQITLKIAGQDPVQLNKSSIQNKEITDLSLMPPGLFEPLSNQEVVNLMAYLQSQKKIK